MSFPFICPFPGGGKVFRTWLDSDSQSGFNSGALFKVMNTGAARSDRWLVAVLSWNGATAVSACSIASVVAAQIVAQTEVAIWIANVQAGTTAQVAVSYNGTTGLRGVSLFSLVGMSSGTAHDFENSTSLMLNVPAGGVIIGGRRGSTTWTGLTQNTTFEPDSASKEFDEQQSAYSVTAAGNQIIGASWGP